jgi:ferric-dicitrate binding protein FerR (iron transport regulator)
MTQGEDPGEEAMAALLRLAGDRDAPAPERRERVREVVEARWREAVRGRRLRRRGTGVGLGLAIAATLLVALWPRTADRGPARSLATLELAVGPVTVAGVPVRPGLGLSAGEVIRTGQAGGAALRLSGGTGIRIDSDSEVGLVSAGVVTLEAGAVYVDSGRSGGGGVRVRTPLGDIRDVGTQFEVRLASGTLEVNVREGRVQLRLPGRSEQASVGESLTLTREGRLERAERPSHGPGWDWVVSLATPFGIEGRSLDDFLAWVARESGRRVRFQGVDAQARRQVLHGSLEGLGPIPALEVVLPTCGLAWRLDDDAILVLPAEPTR